MILALLSLVAQIAVTDPYTGSSGISTQSGSEVAGGVLRNTDIGGVTNLSFDGVDVGRCQRCQC